MIIPNTYAKEFPEQASRIRTGEDFTLIPPGTYTALPPENLFGAMALEEREGILEVLVLSRARMFSAPLAPT